MLFIADESLKREKEIFTKIMELFQIIKKQLSALNLNELIDQMNLLKIDWKADLGINIFRYLQDQLW